jgi:hypothetical protein
VAPEWQEGTRWCWRKALGTPLGSPKLQESINNQHTNLCVDDYSKLSSGHLQDALFASLGPMCRQMTQKGMRSKNQTATLTDLSNVLFVFFMPEGAQFGLEGCPNALLHTNNKNAPKSRCPESIPRHTRIGHKLSRAPSAESLRTQRTGVTCRRRTARTKHIVTASQNTTRRRGKTMSCRCSKI